MVIRLLWIDLISSCRHFTLNPVKINKHIVNLICRKCGLACATWESDLVDGPIRDYTDADRELLK
jgi:transcription elongation factor Elf1